jgi:predicted porin
MNKKLLTIAVAAAMAAPMAVQADATIYGKLHLSLDWVDYSDNNANADGDGYKYNATNNGYCTRPGLKGWDLCSRASRLGFKGSEDLGNGLKAIWKIETQVYLADVNTRIADGDPGTFKFRNTYLGLAGGWGTLLAGRHDTPLKMSTAKQDIFSDTMADYNLAGNLQDIRADNAVAYVSPNWAGFTLAGAIVPTGGSTVSGAYNPDADGLAEGWSVAAQYDNGPFFAALAYELFQQDMLPANDDWKKWRAGLGWNADLFKVNFIWETQEDYQNSWVLNGQFNFGNNAVKAMYTDSSAKKNNGIRYSSILGPAVDTDAWAVGLDHYFSKRSTVYLLYTDKDAKGKDLCSTCSSSTGDWKGWSMGMIHTF